MTKKIPIKIMSCIKAREYDPDKKTYAIRLFEKGHGCDLLYGKLKDSENYLAIKEYRFDDVDYIPELEEGDGCDDYPINDEIAKSIIKDFAEYRNSVDELLVHCRAGQSRSPAVATALNEIFNLGNDNDYLMSEYTDMNPLVYEVMLRNRL